MSSESHKDAREVDILFPYNPHEYAKNMPRSLCRAQDRYVAELAWQAWAAGNPTEAKHHRERLKSVNPRQGDETWE